ncbi:MAG: hypothetical protein KDJ19_04305 [Hyphomicrobiaceae bacterium]|nr:hypothetical protein [Hyphomicrobiaceae bacterium]MCC0023521.1 hypothetical protein [Hyphomicrobiaceae bacterium]
MNIWVLLILVIGLTLIMHQVLRPLRVLRRREFWLAHLFMWAGLWMIWGFVVFQHPEADLSDMTMLMGAIWTLGGGICFAFLYVTRHLAANKRGNE